MAANTALGTVGRRVCDVVPVFLQTLRHPDKRRYRMDLPEILRHVRVGYSSCDGDVQRFLPTPAVSFQRGKMVCLEGNHVQSLLYQLYRLGQPVVGALDYGRAVERPVVLDLAGTDLRGRHFSHTYGGVFDPNETKQPLRRRSHPAFPASAPPGSRLSPNCHFDRRQPKRDTPP